MSIPIQYDTISSDEFKTQLVTLKSPQGLIVGHKKIDGFKQQKWHFIAKGGDSYAIQAQLEATEAAYLGPNGKHLALTLKEYTWHVVPKSDPLPGHYFETTDRELTWFLPNGEDDTQIELKPVKDLVTPEDKQKAEWVWNKT